jgi:hypothetical protein
LLYEKKEKVCYRRMKEEIYVKEKEPFNDVEDHLDKVTGNPYKGSHKNTPKGIKIIGYVIIAFFVVLFITTIIGIFLN